MALFTRPDDDLMGSSGDALLHGARHEGEARGPTRGRDGLVVKTGIAGGCKPSLSVLPRRRGLGRLDLS